MQDWNQVNQWTHSQHDDQRQNCGRHLECQAVREVNAEIKTGESCPIDESSLQRIWRKWESLLQPTNWYAGMQGQQFSKK